MRGGLGAARLVLSRLAAETRLALSGVARYYRSEPLSRHLERLRREVFGSARRGHAVYALVVLALFSFAVWDRFLIPLAGAPYFKPGPSFEVVGFFENGAGGLFGDSLPALERTAGLYDTVSPFWYSINGRGDLVGDGYRPEVVRFASSRGLRVTPLVSNYKGEADHSAAVVTDPTARRRAVENLAALTDKRGYDGLVIDFELLPAGAKSGFALFAADLAQALHARGRTLAIAVFPDVELPPEVSGFFDYQALGRAADRIVMMAYDRHWPATGVGPISPEPWAEASLDSLLRYVPASKVLLGIGTHAYDWPVDEATGLVEYLPTAAALERAAAFGATATYDQVSRQTSLAYQDEAGRWRVIWIEDAPHVADKVALARSRGLGGIAIWRLGFSEPAAETALAQGLGRSPDRRGR